MVSVNDILAYAPLALEPVVVAAGSAAVRWVATSELADPSPFMEGGEILLTTGLVQRSEAGWMELVASLQRAGVVALGFGVGLSHPEVPAGLHDAALELGFNLFVVPRPVPFIAVSRAVADLLWAAERDVDRLSLQHQRALTKAALAPESSEGIIVTLAQIVSGRVIIASSSGALQAMTLPRADAEALAVRAKPMLKRLDAQGTRGTASEIAHDTRVTVHPIGTGSRAENYLIVECESPTNRAQRTAVTTALALLTLEGERRLVELTADRKIRAGALTLALRGDMGAASDLLAGASRSAALPTHRVRVIRARGSDADLRRALGRLEGQAEELGSPLAALMPDATSDLQLVAAIAADEARLAHLLDLLDGLQVGVGPERAVARLAQSDEGAARSLALTSSVRSVVRWTELIERGVDSLLDHAALSAYAEELLRDVLHHPDAEQLLASLLSFLTHNGQIGPAAAGLGVHRNTLRNRLSVAEDALGRSLQDPQTRSDLWIALKQIDLTAGVLG